MNQSPTASLRRGHISCRGTAAQPFTSGFIASLLPSRSQLMSVFSCGPEADKGPAAGVNLDPLPCPTSSCYGLLHVNAHGKRLSASSHSGDDEGLTRRRKRSSITVPIDPSGDLIPQLPHPNSCLSLSPRSAASTVNLMDYPSCRRYSTGASPHEQPAADPTNPDPAGQLPCHRSSRSHRSSCSASSRRPSLPGLVDHDVPAPESCITLAPYLSSPHSLQAHACSTGTLSRPASASSFAKTYSNPGSPQSLGGADSGTRFVHVDPHMLSIVMGSPAQPTQEPSRPSPPPSPAPVLRCFGASVLIWFPLQERYGKLVAAEHCNELN